MPKETTTLAQVRALIAEDMTMEQIAERLGISRQTLYNRLRARGWNIRNRVVLEPIQRED